MAEARAVESVVATVVAARVAAWEAAGAMEAGRVVERWGR